MKRSEINRTIREAEALMAEHRFALPPWAAWSPEEWRADPDTARFCAEHQMGWDITDFGGGRFVERGLLLFCIRNGIQNVEGERLYAEKIMMVGEEQETPFHAHEIKMEDIIVRGGGRLVIELYAADEAWRPLDAPLELRLDGMKRVVAPREPVSFGPGQSITVPRRAMHRFYGEKGFGTVLVGEVSQVNDDFQDNYFAEPVGRFATIEEDEPAYRPLWTEVAPGP